MYEDILRKLSRLMTQEGFDEVEAVTISHLLLKRVLSKVELDDGFDEDSEDEGIEDEELEDEELEDDSDEMEALVDKNEEELDDDIDDELEADMSDSEKEKKIGVNVLKKPKL